MSWRDLLVQEEVAVLPWVGGAEVISADDSRSWEIKGRRPREFGWYSFTVTGGRDAILGEAAEADPDFGAQRKCLQGYVVGARFIPDDARVDPDPTKLAAQTEPVLLVERGLERFARGVVVRVGEKLVYLRQEFPQGPEVEVEDAFLEGEVDVVGVAGVTPALDLAFRWMTWLRAEEERRRREVARRRREAEERRAVEAERRRLQGEVGTGDGRRRLAQVDFAAAARAALGVSGATYLGHREARGRGEMVVQYRLRARRFECVVGVDLRVVDSGICLTDERTGDVYDDFFTLESLPAVVMEAIDTGVLVVTRHT